MVRAPLESQAPTFPSRHRRRAGRARTVRARRSVVSYNDEDSSKRRPGVNAGWTQLQSNATPVAWIGGYAWSQRNDAARYGDLGTYESRADDNAAALVEDADPLLVDDQRRKSAPRLPIDRTLPVPSAGERGDWVEALARTPDVVAFWNPARWPVCCARLGVLVVVNPTSAELRHIEEIAGPLDDASLEPNEAPVWLEGIVAIRRNAANSVGINLFHCRSCGALYGVPSHT